MQEQVCCLDHYRIVNLKFFSTHLRFWKWPAINAACQRLWGVLVRAKLFPILATIVALFAQPAAAAVMQATFTGTIAQPAGPLNGRAFTSVFRYDTTIGFQNLQTGIQQISGSSGLNTLSPVQYLSMRIAGAPEYDLTVANPGDFASIVNYASAFNQFYGSTGLLSVHAEYDFRDNSAGYLEFAIFDIGGFTATGLTLDAPFAGPVSAAGTNQYSSGLFVNHIQVSSLSVGLVPTHVTVEGYSAVPEPASWAMLIAGFGLTGAAMRRRRGQNMPSPQS
jgi:hypothetical protein